MKDALHLTPKDERDFQLGAITKLPKLETLPESFILPYITKKQPRDDHCTGYMSTAMSEPQEGVELNPDYSFAASKEISGELDKWGQNIRDALKAHIEYGALDEKDFDLKDKDEKFLRVFSNWPKKAIKLAWPHRKKSFFKVTGQYDDFDNTRAALYKFQSVVGTGVKWSWSMGDVVLNTVGNGYGHAIAALGYTTFNGEPVIIVTAHGGEDAGQGGIHYMTRDVYNHFAGLYGAYMFVDISKEEAKYKLSHGLKIEDNWLVELLKILYNIFKYGK